MGEAKPKEVTEKPSESRKERPGCLLLMGTLLIALSILIGYWVGAYKGWVGTGLISLIGCGLLFGGLVILGRGIYLLFKNRFRR